MTNSEEVKLFFGLGEEKYYGMFTEAGNQAIDGLVVVAKALELTWPQVYSALRILADNPKFREATDTAVREYVYDACGFDSKFYI
jgi:hypothetical protein